ncbi:phage tail terminator family protein [Anaerovorax odorimutans]|uniref:phage tail terminator family protein n=1 Tax=Anaerovorax odorimutans TaxID=109327 RepID=UPI00040D38E3|nr:hypothetical protein [Anaerovorax odorimutans]
MVTYRQIINAINLKIKTKFSNVTIQSKENNEELERPFFKINFKKIKTSNFMNTSINRDLKVMVYYYPQNKEDYLMEFADMQQQLEELFLKDNVIKIDSGTSIEVYETEIEVIDGILQFLISMELSEELNNVEEISMMEDLNL